MPRRPIPVPVVRPALSKPGKGKPRPVPMSTDPRPSLTPSRRGRGKTSERGFIPDL